MSYQFSNYRIKEQLGSGAYGEVYYCSDSKNENEPLAVKKYSSLTNKTLNLIENGISILKSLDHPNIIKFKGMIKNEDNIYLFMEYCDGGSLFQTLKNYIDIFGTPFSQEIVQYLMTQIISGLNYIHKNNIIHRDIKLENILINFKTEEDKKKLNILNSNIKIADFDSACILDKSSKLYADIMSTPFYMDPKTLKYYNENKEKTDKLVYEQKSDIWSLGILCLIMLEGKNTLYDGDDLEELEKKNEIGNYFVSTTLYKETISFIISMLQYDSKNRLTCEELLKHPFITTKDVNNFNRIPPMDLSLLKCLNRVNDSKIKINIKEKTPIWAISNADNGKNVNKIDNYSCGYKILQ